MTLIAGFSVATLPVLIGDLLLSGPEDPNRSVSLPTIGDSLNVFPKGSGFTITGLTQKVNILSDRLMVAWAGRRYIAESILRELRERCALAPFTIENLKAFFESFQRSENRNEVQFAGTMVNERQSFSFSIGCEVVSHFVFGDIRLGGSGTEDAKEFFRNLEEAPVLLKGVAPEPLLDATSKSLMLTAHLMQLELTNRSSLLQFYGGGYELASLVQGRFAKIGHVTYLFWEVDATGNQIRVSYPYQVFKYTYANDVLGIRSARIDDKGHGELTVTDEGVHLVGPAFREITEKDINAFWPNAPHLNSQFLVNFFLVHSLSRPFWLNRIDYRFTPNTHVVFRESPERIEILIEKTFVEDLTKSLSRILQKVKER